MNTTNTNAERLSTLLKQLPAPEARYKGRGTLFEIYRSKDLGHRQWRNSALKKILAESRMAYARYGKRKLFDAYDGKAAIYIVRVIYSSSKRDEHIEEWLSIRMVPGNGSPRGVAEPEIYMRAGKSIDYWMKKKIGKKDFWHAIASSSRMCGIHPYRVSSRGEITFSENPQHRYTVICFALIHKQFSIDYPLNRFPYQYITAIVRPDFYETRLAYQAGSRRIHPTHIAAHRFLGVTREEIKVKRGIYSYAFPLYWLHGDKLLALLNRLRKKEHQPALASLTSDLFKNLNAAGKRPVNIAGMSLSPVTMRKLIDRFVPDVPELKITEARKWYRGMEAVLRAARVEAVVPRNSGAI